MKRFLVLFILMFSCLATSKVFACSTNCVDVQLSGDIMTVTGYNAKGEAVYIKTVSIAATDSSNISGLSTTDESATTTTTGSDSSSSTSTLANGGSVVTTTNTFTTSTSIIIVTFTAIYDASGNLLSLDVDRKEYSRFEMAR